MINYSTNLLGCKKIQIYILLDLISIPSEVNNFHIATFSKDGRPKVDSSALSVLSVVSVWYWMAKLPFQVKRWKTKQSETFQIPFFASLLHAGFPSPADDYKENILDLMEFQVWGVVSCHVLHS